MAVRLGAEAQRLRDIVVLALREIDALAGEAGTDPATSGFRRYVLSAIVNQPSEVEALLDAATGARSSTRSWPFRSASRMSCASAAPA